MTDRSFSIPEDLYEKMKKYPQVNWESITRSALKNYINMLENEEYNQKIDAITKISEDSLKEFLENEPDLYTDEDLKLRY
ncbi:MAG: hypothetical protein V3V33_00315 [Candidatus Lokiarchaeia archaeon]